MDARATSNSRGASVPVRDSEGQSTGCAGCGVLLIERDAYALGEWSLDAAGSCRACGARCPGVFEASPGRWGARRRPVRLADFAPAPA
jgi:pyruvate formate lyase activating enzyme